MPSGRRNVPVMHRCEQCGDEYPWWNTRAPKGKCARCNRSSPEWFAANHRLRKYGLTQERFLEMLATQHDQCAICGHEFTEDDGPCVDHNHVTGMVRELLCAACNRGLGCFDECPERLRMAADYLEAHA